MGRMTTASEGPTYSFDAVRNFRDCGGYRAGDRKFRGGMLFRSGHMALASDADLQTLKRLEIATIVDLRRASERALNPCRRWPDFSARVIERDGGKEAELAPHLLALREIGRTGEAPGETMCRMYRLMPFEPMIIALMRDFLLALAEADGPVLVHCAAGKDRTGLAVALAHHITGVTFADMLENYLQSRNTAPLDAETLERVRTHLAPEGRPLSDEAIRAVLLVEPEYLAAMLKTIDESCGSLDGYIDETLGLSGAQRAAIVRRMTV
jgi:protein tyrosine/serine phosphatase